MKFEENLRNLRKEKDYSQEFLSAKLGVTRQTISKWENGTAMPDLKKLVELAEFFEVSMDSLLGMEHYSKNDYESKSDDDIKKENEYTNYLISMIGESSNKAWQKKINIALIILSVVLFISVILCSNSFRSLKDKISNLETNIMYWSNEISNLRESSSSDFNNEYYDIEINILEYSMNAPEIVKVEFRYSPSNYPKNSKIYYLVPNKNGGVDKLEATDNNGEFLLTADVDLSLSNPCYFVLDDGENIIKQELNELSMYSVYGGFDTSADVYNNYFSVSPTAKDNSYLFTPSINTLGWSNGLIRTGIVSREIVVENNGTEVYREKLDDESEAFDEDLDYANISARNSFVINDFTPGKINIYLKITGKNGIIYKQHIPYFVSEKSFVPSYDELSGEACSEIVFTVDGKESAYKIDCKN